MEPEKRTVISTSTSVSVGLLVTIIVGLATLLYRTNESSNRIELQAEQTRSAIASVRADAAMQNLQLSQKIDANQRELQGRLDNLGTNGFSLSDMNRWARELEKQNPSLKVPEPDHR